MIVALTAWRRPAYLSAVLDSLAAAGSRIEEPVFLVARVEPSDKQEEMLALIGHDRGTYVEANESLLGCCWNTRAVLDDAWRIAAHFDEDFVFMLEEDFVLAPDALELTQWQREKYRSDKDVLVTGLFNRAPYFAGTERQVTRDRNFVGQGWGTWRDRWVDIRPQWHDRKFEDRGPVSTPNKGYYLGWDVNLDTNIMQGRAQIRPLVSRVLHIGEHLGQHTTPSIYPKTLPIAYAGDGGGLPGVQDSPSGEGEWFE